MSTLPRIGARREGGHLEAGRQLDRQVLQAVHGEVESAVEKAALQLEREEPLAAGGAEVAGQDVPRGGKGHQLDFEAGMELRQLPRDGARLRESERAAPGAEAQRGGSAGGRR